MEAGLLGQLKMEDWCGRHEGEQSDRLSLSETNWQRVQSKQTSSSRGLWSKRMPRTNQHVSQFACVKRKYYQLQKLRSSLEHMSRGMLLWVYRIGLWIDHKNSISKGLRNYEVFSLCQTSTTQTPTQTAPRTLVAVGSQKA